MAEVRKVYAPSPSFDDFAPSELYIVVLTKDDTTSLCQTSCRWNIDKEQTLKRILDSTFHLLGEVLA